ncbi:phage integrase central domain-containing protein [Huaxiibacter chinensis]|uniref:phage integrase central domain-containing protein n=1 Tax=Huaxiibacter chinensis TaxID=2899785 RepID=UPI003D32107A
MAVLTRPLSAPEVQKAKPVGKYYELFDGQGLALFIRSSGKKIWRFRYNHHGSIARTTITLGYYSAMSLASARTLHTEHLSLLLKGVDPKKLEQEEVERDHRAVDALFINVVTKWFLVKKIKISADYANVIWTYLERDVFPIIGQTPITELKVYTLVNALEPVRGRGALETLHRLTQCINEVMVFAINTGLLAAIPATIIGDAFVKPKKQHMPTIRPELLQRVYSTTLSPLTRMLLHWQLLTLVRPAEATGAMGYEVDMEKRLWTIPPERMKMRREHQVPLSPQVMKVLE